MNREFDALVAQLGPLVLEWLVANSTAAGEIETVRSLDNVKALAAYRRVGGTEKTVEVPLNLLTRPIDDIVAICERAAASVVDGLAGVDAAVDEAIEAAGTARLAAQIANEAAATILTLKEETLAAAEAARAGAKEARDEAALAHEATEESKIATGKANEATAGANDAEGKRAVGETGRVDAEKSRVTEEGKRASAEEARAATEKERAAAEDERATAEGDRVSVEQARETAEGERAAAETTRDKAEKKRTTDTAAMLKDAAGATRRMTELSDHPTKIGEDHYVYRWDESAKAYLRTDIYVKGEGLDYTTMTPEERANVKGKSAYEVAVDKGFEGTVEEWLVSLEGKRGEKGEAGDRGEQGERGEKGETGEVGARGNPGADGADGRDFEVPTLAAAPGEDTLSYGQPATPFRIGQLARVWDAEKGEGGEWVFWQLFDLSDGKALWKLSGSGELPGETLIITLTINQPGYDDHLLGVPIRVKYRDEVWNLVWQGQPITVQVDPVVDCRVECGDVPLFATPATSEFVSNIGYTRMLKLTYRAERATITAASAYGGPLAAATVTVTDEDTSEVRYTGAVGGGIELLIPYGHHYRVAGEAVEGYYRPEDRIFTAESVSRAVTVEYRAFTRLVFDMSIADPENITGAGTGAIVDILAKMRRCLCKKTAEGEVAACYLNNSNSNLYADGSAAVLTGAEGDVMVYKPPFYYKHEMVDATRFAYTLSEYDMDGTCIYSPASLIGAYKSNSADNKLHSRSGVYPSGDISQVNNMAYANARGIGYSLIDFEQHCMIALLFYAKYGTRDSQAVLGTGNAKYSTYNGSTNARGNADTVGATIGHASFAGIEGIHGGVFEWVGGVTILADMWTITNPDGTSRSGNAPAAMTYSWIKKIAAAVGPYFDMIPTAIGGSETTHFTDHYDGPSGSPSGSHIVARSCYSAEKHGGVSYIDVRYNSSVTHAYFASRLAFRGVIREAESVAAFKALPVL